MSPLLDEKSTTVNNHSSSNHDGTNSSNHTMNTANHHRESSSGSQFTAVNGAAKPADITSTQSTVRPVNPPAPSRSTSSPDRQLQQQQQHLSQTGSHESLSGSGEDDISDISSSNLQSPTTPGSHPDPKYLQAAERSHSGHLKPSSASPDIYAMHKRKRSHSPGARMPGARIETHTHRDVSANIDRNQPQFHSHNMPMTNDTRMSDVHGDSGRNEHVSHHHSAASSERIAQRATEEASRMEDLRSHDNAAYEAQVAQQLQGTPHSDHIRSYEHSITPGMSPTNGSMSRTPGQPETKRKRIFSNRTKTGCITCRRRKKKCDEGKPQCNNCKRGGFVCEGYAGKVNWQGISTSRSAVPQMSQSSIERHSRANDHMSPKDQPADLILAPRHRPAPINANFAAMNAPVMRSAERSAPLPPMEYGRHQTSSQPVQQSSVQHDAKSYGSSGLPLSGPAPPVVAAIRRESMHHHQAPEPKGPSQPSPFSGPRVPPQPPLPQRFSSTEKERMLNGEMYHAFTPELIEERERCRGACWKFNNAANPLLGISREERLRLLMEILRPSFGTRGPVTNNYMAEVNERHLRKTLAMPESTGIGGYPANEEPWVETPFICDYGYNIILGHGVFINYGCTIIDTCAVTIKARTIIGPNVNIYSGTHPLNPRTRNGTKGPEFGKPVTIEEDCWIAGNVTILPGVKIGAGATVGAGSVVTKDVPPHTVVAGNPAKVIKGILEHE